MIAAVSEVTGYKAGLALTRSELASHASAYERIWTGNSYDVIRVRSEEFQQIIGKLLYELGNIPDPHFTFPEADLVLKHRSNPRRFELAQNVLQLFVEIFPRLGETD
jgi:hypothetical protein